MVRSRSLLAVLFLLLGVAFPYEVSQHFLIAYSRVAGGSCRGFPTFGNLLGLWAASHLGAVLVLLYGTFTLRPVLGLLHAGGRWKFRHVWLAWLLGVFAVGHVVGVVGMAATFH